MIDATTASNSATPTTVLRKPAAGCPSSAADVLHEAVRPALQLLAHEVEVVRLDRVAHRLRHEAHLVTGAGRFVQVRSMSSALVRSDQPPASRSRSVR